MGTRAQIQLIGCFALRLPFLLPINRNIEFDEVSLDEVAPVFPTASDYYWIHKEKSRSYLCIFTWVSVLSMTPVIIRSIKNAPQKAYQDTWKAFLSWRAPQCRKDSQVQRRSKLSRLEAGKSPGKDYGWRGATWSPGKGKGLERALLLCQRLN